MRWGNMWQCEARLLYEAKRRALGTRYMVTFFFQFVSSPIVWFLAVKQNLSEPKLNLLLLWSCSRRILKERWGKWLLPQSRSGRIMNRKGCSWHALRARNAHLLLLGFDLLHHAEFSLVRKPQIKLIHFCIEDGNSPLFNDQLLIKRADNVLRKVTKYPADWTHSFIVGMISIYSKENTHTFSLHYPVLLLCPFALYCVQNKDNYWPIHQWSIDELSAKCR